MQVVQSPVEKELNSYFSIFLAGGISNCGNWAKELIDLLSDTDLIIYNPRRDDYKKDDPTAEEYQVNWEYKYLSKVNAYSFWFTHETYNPITLFELGTVIKNTNKPIFIGCHPDYMKKNNLIIQMKLYRPEIKVVHSLYDLSQQIKNWTLSPF